VAMVPACMTSAEIDLEGRWSGQWTSGPTTGNLEVTFSGKRPFGDITLYDVTLVATGASCPLGQDRGAGDRTAAFRIDDVRFAVRFAADPPGAGEGVFLFDGALLGSREINGSYEMTSASCPACICGMGSSGSWRLLR